MHLPPYRFTAAGQAPETAPTLLLLHGTGGTETDLPGIGADLTAGRFSLLGVRGRVPEGGTTTRHFRRLASGVFDEADLHARTARLADDLAALSEKEKFSLSNLVALGYSKGANMAGSLLLRFPDLLAGALLWRPMLPFAGAGRPAPRAVPVLLLSGRNDPYYQPRALSQYLQMLQEAGFVPEHRVGPQGHGPVPDDLTYSRQWLKKHTFQA